MSQTAGKIVEQGKPEEGVQKRRHLYLLIFLLVIVSIFGKPILDSSVATLKPGGDGEKIILLIAPFIITCTVCITLLEIVLITFLRVFRNDSMRNLFNDFLKYLGFGASIGGSLGIVVAVVSMMGAYSESLPNLKSVDYVGILASLGLYTSFVMFLIYRFPKHVSKYSLNIWHSALIFNVVPLVILGYLQLVFSFSSDSIRADLRTDFYPNMEAARYSTNLFDFLIVFIIALFIFFISRKRDYKNIHEAYSKVGAHPTLTN